MLVRHQILADNIPSSCLFPLTAGIMVVGKKGTGKSNWKLGSNWIKINIKTEKNHSRMYINRRGIIHKVKFNMVGISGCALYNDF